MPHWAWLIEVEIANRLARVGRLFRLFHGFLEFLFEQLGGVLLILDRLSEDGIAAAVLFLHGPCSFLDVVEHLRLYGASMRDHRFRVGINLQNRIATRTGDFEQGGTFRHLTEIILQTEGSMERHPQRQNMEESEHLKAQQQNGDHYRCYRHQLTRAHSVAVRFKASGYKTQDVERGEPEHKRPQDVVDVATFLAELHH